MPPSGDAPEAEAAARGTLVKFGDLNLAIIGLGVEYPPFKLGPDDLNILVARHYPDTPAMRKVLAINQYTGIDYRSAVGTVDHPLANQKCAPNITELCEYFVRDAVPYAVTAARKAILEAGIDIAHITHVVSTTCTNSANPGYDHYVCKGLGITHSVEKVLLHGIGCSGGLAALRTAANLALGASFRGRPARLLVIALEISSLLCCGLEQWNWSKWFRGAVYELLGWDHRMIPDTEDDLRFDAHPLGWKVVLSHRVPKLAASVVGSVFNDLVSSLPDLPRNYSSAAHFDWALHPGGATILSSVERTMGISAEHIRASYDTYINHGNSSSATIFSVMDRLREKDMDALAPSGEVKDFVVGCAFGPGIAIEMCMLKRNTRHVPREISREVTPPQSERDTEGEDVNSTAEMNLDKSLEEAIDGVELD